jgi:hypothetical protein
MQRRDHVHTRRAAGPGQCELQPRFVERSVAHPQRLCGARLQDATWADQPASAARRGSDLDRHEPTSAMVDQLVVAGGQLVQLEAAVGDPEARELVAPFADQ